MAPRQIHYLRQLFYCAILFVPPRIDYGQVLRQHRTLDSAFADRYQPDRALALAHCVVLISQGCVNYTERAESRCIVGLIAHYLLEFFSRGSEGGASCRLIAAEPGNKALAPTVREWNVFLVTPASAGWHGG